MTLLNPGMSNQQPPSENTLRQDIKLIVSKDNRGEGGTYHRIKQNFRVYADLLSTLAEGPDYGIQCPNGDGVETDRGEKLAYPGAPRNRCATSANDEGEDNVQIKQAGNSVIPPLNLAMRER